MYEHTHMHTEMNLSEQYPVYVILRQNWTYSKLPQSESMLNFPEKLSIVYSEYQPNILSYS